MSKPALFCIAKSALGLALVGSGISVLQANFSGAFAFIDRMLIAARTASPGPAVMLMALQAADISDQHLVRTLLQHTLLTFWPLLLILAGGLLSRPAAIGRLDCLPKKLSDAVDFAPAASTLK